MLVEALVALAILMALVPPILLMTQKSGGTKDAFAFQRLVEETSFAVGESYYQGDMTNRTVVLPGITEGLCRVESHPTSNVVHLGFQAKYGRRLMKRDLWFPFLFPSGFQP